MDVIDLCWVNNESSLHNNKGEVVIKISEVIDI